ncbi:sterol desaturase family protein [Vibrio neonatus]|uniref:sterol desaturase family protein n=1 Tax=Vibrio neonatus TaxID=278860 RepID=UPI0021C28BA9|nr:sterol desaturase family protein [Vibrio neonatus]
MDVAYIRVSIFTAVLVSCALAEYWKPKRPLRQPKLYRWANNLGLTGLNSVLIYITMPLLAVEAALWAQSLQIGLFNELSINFAVIVVISVLILDFAIYWQHRLFHSAPICWNLHKVHHADQDIDVTTGARFHPLEIWISMWIKICIVISFGIPPIAVIVFEILLNGSAMFNHSNISIPRVWDKRLRKLIVTPDMHRVHHSTIRTEADSNFGFFLSIWDHLFDTHTERPKLGHYKMNIGISQFRSRKEQRLDKMLTQPFRKK